MNVAKSQLLRGLLGDPATTSFYLFPIQLKKGMESIQIIIG